MPEPFDQKISRKIGLLEQEVRRLAAAAGHKIGGTVSDADTLDGYHYSDFYAADLATKTVGAGHDFATIQAALDWARLKFRRGVGVVINVDPGDYNEAVESHWPDNYQGITLQGDTRDLAGQAWVSGNGGNTVPILRAAAGVGNVTLSNSGNNLTITCTTTNPDLDADGWGSGDRAYVRDNSGTWTLMTISSVLNNQITFTTTSPTVGNLGTAVVLLPNRRIYNTGTGPITGAAATMAIWGSITVKGFWIDRPAATGTGVLIQNGPMTYLERVAISGGNNGYQNFNTAAGTLYYSTVFRGPDGSSSGGSLIEFRHANGGYCRYNTAIDKASANGFYAWRGSGYLDCTSSMAVGCNIGFVATLNSGLTAPSAWTVNCTYGFYADYDSYVNYSPGGNVGTSVPFSPVFFNALGNYRGALFNSSYSAPENGMGTAFPGTPYAGMRWFRTDLGLLCYYDGTRWLTVNEYVAEIRILASTVDHAQSEAVFQRADYALYVSRVVVETYVGTTNNGSNYWEVAVNSFNRSFSSPICIALPSTAADSANSWNAHDSAASNNPPSGYGILSFQIHKTGSPGELTAAAAVYYRMIIT